MEELVLEPITTSTCKIPRWIGSGTENPTDRQLHVFTDASEKGFGSIAYLRTLHHNGEVTVSFIMAKYRVAPLLPQTIPRLELQGAVTSFRLAHMVRSTIHFPEENVFYWTDSKIVVQWICSAKGRFTVFVGNRVGEFQEGSTFNQ